MLKKMTLIALAVSANLGFADTFDEIEKAHNTGAPMATVLAAQAAGRWEGGFEDSRGHASITQAHWSEVEPGVGIARWYLVKGDVREYGWLIVEQTDQGAKWWFTKRGPTKINAAVAGQGADSASTAAALSRGFVEGNPLLAPLGAGGIVALKMGLTIGMQQFASTGACVDYSTAAGPIGAGAAAWNIGVMAGAGPVAIIPGLAATVLASRYAEPAVWRCLPNDLRTAAARW